MITGTMENINKLCYNTLIGVCTPTYLRRVVYHQHYHADLTSGTPQKLENYKASFGLQSSSEN